MSPREPADLIEWAIGAGIALLIFAVFVALAASIVGVAL